MRPPCRSLPIATVSALVLALSGCGDDGTSPPPPPVTVAVAPTTAQVPAGGNHTFTATVSNASNTAVTWSATGGTLSGAGASVTWTAPVSGGPFTITATSVESPSASASATATVTPIAVAVSPSPAGLFRGEPRTFTATVSGAAGSSAVTWTTTCGDATPEGLTLAMVAPTEPGSCTVTATSTVDPSRSATVEVTIRPDWLVNTLEDTVDGSCDWSHCSLREAWLAANADPDPSVIRLGTAGDADPGQGAASVPLSGALVLSGGLPILTTPAEIIGPGRDALTLDAGGSAGSSRRVVHLDGGSSVLIRGLTLRGGHAAGGAGVLVQGGSELVLMDSRIMGNVAPQGGGAGLLALGGSVVRLENTLVEENLVQTGPGGGLRVMDGSALHVTGGAIRNNEAANGWGGGVSLFQAGASQMTGVEITGNSTVGPGGGGGLIVEATELSLGGITVAGNSAAVGGGGMRVLSGSDVTIENSSIHDNETPGFAGGIELAAASRLTLRDTEIHSNRSVTCGGGMCVFGGSTLVVEGGSIRNNQVTGGGGGAIFAQQATLELTEVELADNAAFIQGGAILMLSEGSGLLDRVTIQGNSAHGTGGNNGWGGAVAVFGTNELTIRDSAIRNNTATVVGGGIYMGNTTVVDIRNTEVTGNEAETASAGGLFMGGASTLTVTGSLFAGNRGSQGGGLQLAGTGSTTIDRTIVRDNTSVTGGGGITSGATLVITNSTLSGNVTGEAGMGGGLWSALAGTTTMRNLTVSGNRAGMGGGIGFTGAAVVENVTVVGNEATLFGGGIGASNAGSPTLRNVLMAGNTTDGEAQNCGTGGGATVTSGGHNLSDDSTCILDQEGDLPDTPAGVEATLAENGGPTPTHALEAGSAAIDAGAPSACPSTDQRGFGRQGVCDIGAFEFEGTPPTAAPAALPLRARAAPLTPDPGARNHLRADETAPFVLQGTADGSHLVDPVR